MLLNLKLKSIIFGLTWSELFL